MRRTYVPKKVAPLNIDLYGYRKPKADRSILKFSYFYLALAIICIICVLLQYKVEEFHKYNILIEAMAAIFLFLSGKTCFSYLKQESNLLKWNVTAGKIIEITENDDGHSLLKLSFFANNQEEVVVNEEFHFKVIDTIEKLNLNSLPIIYQPIRYTKGAYYVDLRFSNGELLEDNLKNIENS